MKSSGKLLNIDVEDLAFLHIKFKTGVYAEINLSYVQNPHKRYIEIVGDKGMLYFNFYARHLKFFPRTRKTWEPWDTLFENEEDAMDKTYVAELEHFIQCIKENQQTCCSIEEGEQALRLALDALK